MAEIIQFLKKNAAEDPDVVLEEAKGQYEKVFILGWDKDGVSDFRSSINISYQEVNWLLDVFKHKMMNGDYFE